MTTLLAIALVGAAVAAVFTVIVAARFIKKSRQGGKR